MTSNILQTSVNLVSWVRLQVRLLSTASERAFGSEPLMLLGRKGHCWNRPQWSAAWQGGKAHCQEPACCLRACPELRTVPRTQTKPCTHSNGPHVKRKEKTICKLLALDYHWQPTSHLILTHQRRAAVPAAGCVVPKEDSSEQENTQQLQFQGS